MNESDIQLKLLANLPIDIDGIGQFQLPTVKEIIQMGENVYNQYVAIMSFSKKNSFDEIPDEIKNISDYELFVNYVYHDDDFKEVFYSSCEIFFGTIPFITDEGLICFASTDDQSILTEDKWMILKKIVALGNYVNEKKDVEGYNPGNDRAKKFMEKLKKQREVATKVKKDEVVNLHSILSAVAWRTSGVNALLDLTFYQLYDGYFRLGYIDNYHYTFTGIYSGSVDGKSIKDSEINWAKVIKIN